MPRRPKKHPGGRPPALPGEPRAATLPLTRVTDEERARALAEASAHGCTLAEWIRRRATHDGADPR
jgi:hypothetical protein